MESHTAAADCPCTQQSLIQVMLLKASKPCPRCDRPVYEHEVDSVKAAKEAAKIQAANPPADVLSRFIAAAVLQGRFKLYPVIEEAARALAHQHSTSPSEVLLLHPWSGSATLSSFVDRGEGKYLESKIPWLVIQPASMLLRKG